MTDDAAATDSPTADDLYAVRIRPPYADGLEPHDRVVKTAPDRWLSLDDGNVYQDYEVTGWPILSRPQAEVPGESND